MTQVANTGTGGAFLLPPPHLSGQVSGASQALANAGDRIGWVGHLTAPGSGASWGGAIHKIHFAIATSTFAGTVRASIQGVSSGKPDGTIGGAGSGGYGSTGALSNPTAGEVTVTLGADVTVALGAALSAVLDFAVAGDFTSGSLGVVGLTTQTGAASGMECITVRDPHTGTYAAVLQVVNVWFEDASGNLATMMGAIPHAALSTPSLSTGNTYSTVATGAEQGIAFVPTRTIKTRTVWVALRPTMTCTLSVYAGLPNSVALASVTITSYVGSAAIYIGIFDLGTELTLTAGSTYVLAVLPSSTTANCIYPLLNLGSAGQRALLPGGTDNSWTGRTGTTAFNQPAGYSQYIPLMGFIPSSLDDGTSAGGPGAGRFGRGL